MVGVTSKMDNLKGSGIDCLGQNNVASATVFPSETIPKRLHNSASIFIAEAQTIIDALDKI